MVPRFFLAFHENAFATFGGLWLDKFCAMANIVANICNIAFRDLWLTITHYVHVWIT